MGAPIVTVSATVLCGHGGKATIAPTSPRVTLGGAPIAVQTSTTIVAGCPFMIGPSPAPCVPVQWTTAATRVTASGIPVLLMNSVGMNTGVGPPVPVSIVATQTRVQGT